VGDELRFVDAGGSYDPRHLVCVHMYRTVDDLEQIGDTGEREAEDGSADVIGVVVRREHADHAHAICTDHVDQCGRVVCRIDQHALTRFAIADGVHEVHHLLGELVGLRKVTTRQKLAEVETVIGGHSHAPSVRCDAMSHLLDHLEPGQIVIYRGNRVAHVSTALAEAFRPGDSVLVDTATGELLHVPADEQTIVGAAVSRALAAFEALAKVPDEAITAFFDSFAGRLEDDGSFAPIAAANRIDVDRARQRNRTTTRLELTTAMRSSMIDGLRVWAAMEGGRNQLERSVQHQEWSVRACRAPLGVVGFVFEGRPNVFADAAGVVRTGNTVVFRIGSDALGTAEAIVEHALDPALAECGLPAGAVTLVASAAHAAGWALFSDARLGLAVARGSGPAVAQLGSVARQAGVPVSLHGTGGAWMVAASDADHTRFVRAVEHSLDRKVCNTLNVCCIERSAAHRLVPAFVTAVRAAAARRAVGARIHATDAAAQFLDTAHLVERSNVVRADGVHDEAFIGSIGVDDLGHEWEWESSPEVSLHVVDDVDEAIELCNRYSPHFVASLISTSPTEHERFYAAVDAPFVGDGMTRWVDGQYALGAPELGLSNWEGGRLLGLGGILSGDSVYTVRYRAQIGNTDLRR
jgi:glutamate-5-semialdehyde dehydrogenase